MFFGLSKTAMAATMSMIGLSGTISNSMLLAPQSRADRHYPPLGTSKNKPAHHARKMKKLKARKRARKLGHGR